MSKQTIAEHRTEIQAAIERAEPAFGHVTPVSGQRWLNAAKQLEAEKKVRVIGAHSSRSDWYVCIPPGATWDYERQAFSR
ncbi:hypothetical protein [Ralstonia pickettii]|uniref:Uncharacterized protein n=1 Tax=Ralstonia pickettii TaxID=329 RepID=A0AAW4Q7H7_RALPI|nr:hypothetical protein [Ralstonia pickettii]MBA9846588.1 hypothetical protein [Ralstonia pickettii]MBA9851917.1 hypothetical protein [Ralstonia pickettii]MBA9919726.1 hypothetical protein [Ralstonia pickettii]MBA9958870.1 hypothetical protein [Ralstonia pickettii]MBA9965059.1 hypothetical protein [Ralstonia pickettii]